MSHESLERDPYENPARSPLVLVPVSSLLPADSPRLDGENEAHIQILAQSDGPLPAILVHRETMRVIDGMHRLRAAKLRGDEKIQVRLFDGTDDAAFLIAVESNIAHGLPLSLTDRKAAAARILVSHPEWSDRAIAASTGLSGKTVGAIRRQSAADQPQPHARIGRDGRVRPVDSAERRHRTSEMIANNPEASVREIAKATGVSASTVHNVRARMRHGEEQSRDERPDTARPASRGQLGRTGDRAEPTHADDNRPDPILRKLRNDPTLRFTDSGRALLRWLDSHGIRRDNWENLLDLVPAHCTSLVADLAQAYAAEWRQLAERLEHHGQITA